VTPRGDSLLGISGVNVNIVLAMAFTHTIMNGRTTATVQ